MTRRQGGAGLGVCRLEQRSAIDAEALRGGDKPVALRGYSDVSLRRAAPMAYGDNVIPLFI